MFSDCSLDQLSVFLDNANPSCLLDIPSSSKLYSGPVCGNAFLDPGEECDCGTVEVLHTHPVSVMTQSSLALKLSFRFTFYPHLSH